MADETVSIQLLIDTSKSATNIEDLEKSTKELNDALQKTEKGTEAFNKLEKATNEANQRLKETVKATGTAEQKFESLKQEIDSGGISIRDMNKKIQEFQTIAIEAGRNSPIGKRALQEAANLRDRMVDIQNETKRLSNDHLRLQGVLEGVQVGVAGFGAMQSITALAGEENEELAKTLTKITATQTLLNSVMAIKVAFEKESNLMTLISIARTEGLSKALGLQTIVTNRATIAQKALNLMMSLNPIGLITVAIAGLVAGIIAFQKPIQDAIAKFERMNIVAKILIAVIAGPLLTAIYTVTKALEFFGVIESKADKQASESFKRRMEEHLKKIKAIDEEIKKTNEQIEAIRKTGKAVELRYDREIELANAAGKDTTRLEGEKLDATIDRVSKEIELLEYRYKLEQDRARETIEMAREQIQGTNALTRLMAKELKKPTEELADNLTAVKQEELKTSKEMLEELLHDREVHNAKVLKSQQDAWRKQQEEKRKQQEEERKRIDAENAELLNDLMGDFERDEQARQAKLEAEKKLANDLAALAIEVTAKEKEEQEKRLEAEREAAKLRAENEAAAQQQQIEIIKSGFQTIIELTDAFAGDSEAAQRKAFNIKKAASIALATIETIQAAQSAYASQMAIPTPDAPIRAAIAAGIAVASGLARVAAIAKTKFESTETTATGGGGGGRGLQGPNSPGQANMLPVTGETVLRGNQMDTKVVVVESDITNVQSRVNVIENQAKVR